MNSWIDTQTSNIITEHAEDLRNRMELLSEHSQTKKLYDIFQEISKDFSDGNHENACIKINLITKMLINNQLDDIEKYRATDIDDIHTIFELSLGLQNAIAIRKSESIQTLIVKENTND